MMMREEYPATWQEFIEDKYFRDYKEIYTNGSEIMLVSDIKKMMQHYSQERPKGRWIELPCEVGSTVWCIYENKVHKAVACKVSVAKGLYNFNLTRIEAEFDIIDSFYNDGRTQKMAIYAIYLENVFLTEEEAEKALADMRESEQHE